jgi:hypothetical protein
MTSLPGGPSMAPIGWKENNFLHCLENPHCYNLFVNVLNPYRDPSLGHKAKDKK